jgi:hypothetical protein
MYGSALSYRTGPARLWCHVQKAVINEEHNLRTITSKRPVLATEHYSTGVHARISVGSEKHAKHGNATLELRPFSISHEIESLDSQVQEMVVHGAMATGAESAQDREHGTHPALSQFMCGLVVFGTDSFYTFFVELIPGLPGDPKTLTGLYPIRSTRNPLAALDDEIAFSLDPSYSKSFDHPIREMMEGIKLDLRIAEQVAGGLSASDCKSEDRFLRHLQSTTKHYEKKDWRNFMSNRTKRPVPKGIHSVQKWQRGAKSKYRPRKPGKYVTEWRPADTWKYPYGLKSLSLNIVHYAAAFNFAEALKYLIIQDSSTGARFGKAHGYLTPLHLACLLGHCQAVDVLLRGSEVQWAEVLS